MAKLLMTWKIFLFVLLTAIMGCEAQTFQYSRGWTNGKRSSSAGGSAYPPSALNQGQLYDMDNGILGVGLPIDDPTVSIPAAVHFLNRKLALGSNSNGNAINSRKQQPIWIGTIMGIDQNQDLSTSGRPSNSNNNSNNPPDF